MRTAVVVYAGSSTDRALLPLAGGASAFDRVLAFVGSLPNLAGLLLLEGPVAMPDRGLSRVTKPSWTDLDIIAESRAFCAGFAEGLEALVFVRADEPFLDPALARKMLESHRKYRADYSFADGYPLGLAAEFVHPRILPALQALAEKAPSPPDRAWLFNVVQRDINSFDIETEISPLDLRDRRISLACDTKRNLLLVEGLMAAGLHDLASALELIPRREDLLRSLPAFVAVQVTGGCPQACKLCPWPLLGGDILARRDFMSADRFAAMMGGLAAFAGDAVVDLSPWGEPSLHPQFPALVDAVLARAGLSLIVETSGLGWQEGVIEGIAARHPGRVDWILSLDAAEPSTYARLRGEGWREAQKTAGLLESAFPGHFHPQLVRHRENESELEAFWRGWKAKTDKVIVQKYSRFVGRLPDLSVADLSPLKRHPCWHLRRDLTVLLDGSVPPCRDLTGAAPALGSLFEGLKEGEAGDAAFFEAALSRVWAAGDGWHRLHARGDLPESCRNCDEYYTYNA
ncbi:MAG TPA: spiro-SPASM protein [Rectinemataceae bacterium]|nr:spiro-SPASM protein [Rectinemataceae bacterium]